MKHTFQGFDHVDTRVKNIREVEPFYDHLMPQLGLPDKRFSYVDERGDWHEPDDSHAYNTVEYFQEGAAGQVGYFIGFIEDRSMHPTDTRIAFRIAAEDELPRWHQFLESIGARNIEPSAAPDEYPAVFFEDPCGTKLELCARVQ